MRGLTWLRERDADTAWAYTLGLLVGALWLGALVHMLAAFPTGRVEPGLERGVVVLGWSAAIALPFLAALVTARPNGCQDCPDNLLLAWEATRRRPSWRLSGLSCPSSCSPSWA